MKMKTLLASVTVLTASLLGAYDVKTVELVPVKFQKTPSHAPVKMIENGKLNFAIVADLNAENRMRGKNRTQKSIEPAIEIIKEAVEKCTGITPQVLDIKNAAQAKYMIVVGDNAITRKNGIDVTKLPPQGLAVKTFDKGIIVAGNDSSLIAGYNSKPLENRGSSLGSKYGAYDFVERFLGVRYYFPGEYGTLWPKIKNLTLTPVSYTDAPYFNDRNGIFYLGDSIHSPRGRQFWTKYLGKLTKDDARFWDRWRMGSTIPVGGTHSPRPERIAKAYPDKLTTIFYKSPAGNHWYNPKAHIGNYYDVVNLEFADLLVDSAKKYYASNGKDNKYGFTACNSTYFSFGMCDTLLPDSDVINHPIVRKLGLMTQKDLDRNRAIAGVAGENAGMANIYARFHQYLAKRLQKELPGISLYIMAYYNAQLSGTDPRWILPPNTEVNLCLGSMPNNTRNPAIAKKAVQIAKDWYISLGNRPVQRMWLYAGTDPFTQAVNGEFVSDLPKLFGKYLGRTSVFFDHCINSPGNYWFFYYSYYAAYRSMWSPKWDPAAAIDAHWEKFYGKEAGKYLRQFHQHLRYCYQKYAMTGDKRVLTVVYPIPEIEKLENLLAQAGKAVKKGTVEEKRYNLVSAPWALAFNRVRNQLAYERPVHNVYQLLRKDKVVIDGKGTEKFWAKAQNMKLIDPRGTTTPRKYPAEIKLAWDKQGIYGLFTMKHSPILADPKRDLFVNDNFEFFLSPGMKREVEYQFVFDGLKQTFFGTQRHRPIPQPFDSYWKVKGFKLECTHGKDFFTAEFFVPYSAMHVKAPAVYDTWHCNVVQNKVSRPKEYSGTSMTLGNNHNLDMYGLIKFAGKGE